MLHRDQLDRHISRSRNLDLKRGWTGMKIGKMATVAYLCNNDKRYDSGKDLSYFNFPRDKQKRKRTPSLECIKYFEFFGPTSLVLNPKWWLRDKGLWWINETRFCNIVAQLDEIGPHLSPCCASTLKLNGAVKKSNKNNYLQSVWKKLKMISEPSHVPSLVSHAVGLNPSWPYPTSPPLSINFRY